MSFDAERQNSPRSAPLTCSAARARTRLPIIIDACTELLTLVSNDGLETSLAVASVAGICITDAKTFLRISLLIKRRILFCLLISFTKMLW